MVAIATARIVWDLEPGTDISPLIIDLLTSSFNFSLRLVKQHKYSFSSKKIQSWMKNYLLACLRESLFINEKM